MQPRNCWFPVHRACRQAARVVRSGARKQDLRKTVSGSSPDLSIEASQTEASFELPPTTGDAISQREIHRVGDCGTGHVLKTGFPDKSSVGRQAFRGRRQQERPSMIRSLLIGLVAGQRGIAPLASIALATRRGMLPIRRPLQSLLNNPVIASGTALLAAAEMAGDKMKSAPDRIVLAGLAVRTITAAYAGAALAPRGRRTMGAAVAVGAALTSSYIGWRARCAAMRRYGQTVTGFVEDAIVLGSGIAVANPDLPVRRLCTRR